ncbi:hepatocellular carcinoma-associated antigen 59-domain-containing protein [Zopfochytrium polystomum]|nr:hepatocellular carcinoma-associated antigen 59-domain-containing protein [Zopfochytrium polystomum]
MFSKKRPKSASQNARKRDLSDDEDEAGTAAAGPTSASADGDGDVGINIADALELRRLRRRRNHGVDAEELVKGDPSLRKKDDAEPAKDPWKLVSGGLVDLAEVRAKKIDPTGTSKTSGGFAAASNTMDTEKKMNEFIERELQKKRAAEQQSQLLVVQATTESASSSPHPAGGLDELYQIPDNLQTSAKPVQEGNVTLSASMLTAIPEVDLGITTKMLNIEETEKAKRAFLEKKANPTQDKLPGQSYTASARCKFLLFQFLLGLFLLLSFNDRSQGIIKLIRNATTREKADRRRRSGIRRRTIRDASLTSGPWPLVCGRQFRLLAVLNP